MVFLGKNCNACLLFRFFLFAQYSFCGVLVSDVANFEHLNIKLTVILPSFLTGFLPCHQMHACQEYLLLKIC